MEENEPAFRLQEGRHRADLARETTFRSRVRRAQDMEYFVVAERRVKEGLPYYTLKDMMGVAIQGTFYQPEFNRVSITDETVYRMEKVLR